MSDTGVISTLRTKFAVPETAKLSIGAKAELLRFAQAVILGATIFSGITIALQIAILAPYPGTKGNNLVRTAFFMVPFVGLGTALKIPMMYWMGPRIERRLRLDRPVSIRRIFNREIRKVAILGGMLNAIYSMLFVFMAPYLAPTALAASRACIVLALIPVEWFARVLPRNAPRSGIRLTRSVAVTLTGAAIVIFAHGFDLFKGHGSPYLWGVFLALLTMGNLCLALAELAEMHGVHKEHTAASVYTLARFVSYAGTCIVIATACVILSKDRHIFWPVMCMVGHRWYFWVPISLGWAATDLVRISVKTVVPATYMYIVASLAVAIDAVTQTVAKHLAPKVYINVPGGWLFPVVCLCGGLVIVVGNRLWPHENHEPSVEPAV